MSGLEEEDAPGEEDAVQEEEEAPNAFPKQPPSLRDSSAMAKLSPDDDNLDTQHQNEFKTSSLGQRKSSRASRSQQEAGSGGVDGKEEQRGKRHKSATNSKTHSLVTNQLSHIDSGVATGKGETEAVPFDNGSGDGQLKGSGSTNGQLKRGTTRQLKNRTIGHLEKNKEADNTLEASPGLDTAQASITGADSNSLSGSESGSASEPASTSGLDSEHESNSQQADVDTTQLGSVDIASAGRQVLSGDMLTGLLKGLQARLSLYTASSVAENLTASKQVQAAAAR